MFQALTDLLRAWRVIRTLARHDALIPHEYLGAMPVSVRITRRLLRLGGSHDARELPGKRLAVALESLGPSYIKLGQILATRPDIVGAETAKALEDLQDNLPAFPTEDAREAVEQSLGRPLDTAFSAFGGPVAAASIAQVHKAETNEDPPCLVAVKVLRPGIETEFRRELAALAFAARIGERFWREARRLRLLALVDALSQSVALELDLRMEAAAASELAERTRSEHDFRVPAIDWSRTAERVLTSEWVKGTPIRDPATLEEAGHDPHKVALQVLRNFLTQALRDGFFHADMHPGNLFIDEEGRLVAVDFGIMGRLDPAMRRFLAETLAGFLARDYVRVAQIHYEVNFVPPHHPMETFAQALRAIGEPIFGRPARDVSMARVLQQLFDTTRRFDMQGQPQLMLLQKTMMVVEGVCRALDPDFDIWEASRPIVERFMLAQVGPEARLRDVSQGMTAIGRAAQNLPQLLRNAETISSMLAEGGLRLHPDTARQIAESQLDRTRHVRIALWLAASALALIAFSWL